MRSSTMVRAAALVVLLTAFTQAEFLRDTRTEIAWTGKLPTKARIDVADEPGVAKHRPLLVYIESDLLSKDQERFDNVVSMIDQFRLATKFFDCVKIKLADAQRAPFLEDIKLKAPSIIVYSGDRSKYKVAKGRVSGMKAVGVMRAIAQADYETKIKETLRVAKVLLGRYDQISAAQNAIDIKTRRWNDSASKGEKAKAKSLRKDIDKDIAAREKHLKETDERWKKLWTLKRKVQKKR